MKHANHLPEFASLPEEVRQALAGAIVSRGNRKGLLKRSCPSPYNGSLPAYLAWQATISVVAPVRMSPWGLTFRLNGSDASKALWRQLDAWAERNRQWVNANLQRPFEFNLWHLHHDPEPEQPASFAVEVEVYGEEGSWHSNGLRFATQKQAEDYAANLAYRWTLVKQTRVVESADPANRGTESET